MRRHGAAVLAASIRVRCTTARAAAIVAAMCRLPLALVAAASVVAAQAPTVPFVVLTRLPGATASALLEVDPVTGASVPLGGFASDTLSPLAVAVDPFDGALFVAVASGASGSLVLRLVRAGAGWAEFPLLSVSAPVVQLEVVGEQLLVAFDAANGGVVRVPRRGGPAALAHAQANLTAVHGFGPNATAAALAWTGRPGSAVVASGTAVVDFATGALWWGPDSFANPTGRETTGVVDLPTAVPRQLLCFDDGTFGLFAGLIGPTVQPVPTTPPVPPGGAVALKPGAGFSLQPVALGGATFPFLYEVDAFSGAVTLRSAALPGDPVDFAPGIDRAAHAEAFGTACGAVTVAQSATGGSALGATLVLAAQGPPASLLLLAGGFDDFAAGALPALLPGGCALEVDPQVLLAFVASAGGTASQTLAIPSAPSLVSTPVFVQWAHLGASGLSTSRAAVHFVGL